MTQQELGLLGENMATRYLKELGHQILARNFHFGKLEVDIVSSFEDKIHFTEVKARQTAEIGEPWQAVTRGKQRQIIRVADHYLKEKELDSEAQFNIASIVYNSFRKELMFIPDAFTT